METENEVKYSLRTLSDGTQYVKLDGNLFEDKDGNQLSPVQAYNRYAKRLLNADTTLWDKIKKEESLSGGIPSEDSSRNIKAQNNQNVKTSAVPTMDSDGRKLSKGMSEFMKDIQIIENLGYDGIIDDSVSEKFKGMHLSPDTVHAIIFDSSQAKLVTNENPTDSKDIRFSVVVNGREVDNLSDVLTPPEYNRLRTLIDSGHPSFRAKDGDNVYRLDDKLVYTDRRKNFGISRIVVANTKNDYDITKILDWFTDAELSKEWSYDEQRTVIGNYYEEGVIQEYTNKDFGNIQRYDRPTERGARRSASYHAEQQRKRANFHFEDEEGRDNVKASQVPTSNTELAKENRKLKKDLADSYKEIQKWKDEIKMIPSRLDYSVSARRRLSTLREAHRDAALGLTTFSKADKIVAKSEGIILLPKGSAVFKTPCNYNIVN